MTATRTPAMVKTTVRPAAATVNGMARAGCPIVT